MYDEDEDEDEDDHDHDHGDEDEEDEEDEDDDHDDHETEEEEEEEQRSRKLELMPARPSNFTIPCKLSTSFCCFPVLFQFSFGLSQPEPPLSSSLTLFLLFLAFL